MSRKDYGYEVFVEGNRVVSCDVLPSGELSCLKADLGTYASPEHAEAVAYVYADTRLFSLFLLGKVTPEIIDNVARLLKERKAAMTDRMTEVTGKAITNGERGCKLTEQPGTGWRLQRWDDDTNYEDLEYTATVKHADILEDIARFLRAPIQECNIVDAN